MSTTRKIVAEIAYVPGPDQYTANLVPSLETLTDIFGTLDKQANYEAQIEYQSGGTQIAISIGDALLYKTLNPSQYFFITIGKFLLNSRVTFEGGTKESGRVIPQMTAIDGNLQKYTFPVAGTIKIIELVPDPIEVLEKRGVIKLWDKIKEKLATKLDLAGGTMTGSIRQATANNGYFLVDREGESYPALINNTSHLWIGAGEAASRHHVGGTYISAGYNNSTNKGYESIYVSVPNAANDGSTNYKVLHAGNAPAYWNTAETRDFINWRGFGWITNSSKSIELLIPYAFAYSGTYTVNALSMLVRFAPGGYGYARSGSSGETYTQLAESGGSIKQIWNNGASVRTNEVESITCGMAIGGYIHIRINFVYALCLNSSGTVITNNTPANGIITCRITRS